MPHSIALSCRCGNVRGEVSGVAPDRINRVVCYCDDCRAYARFLERPDLLDRHGGTDIVQVQSTTVRFSAGQDQLRCMRLSPRGMTRWYTDCCHTPVGNTVMAAVPFAGIVRSCLDAGLVAAGGAEAVLGPAEGCNARFAVHGKPAGAHERASAGLVLRVARRIAKWKLRSLGQRSEYFDASGAPARAPRVLEAAEREALAARDAEPIPG
jgi:hypothetical protein